MKEKEGWETLFLLVAEMWKLDSQASDMLVYLLSVLLHVQVQGAGVISGLLRVKVTYNMRYEVKLFS